MQKLTQIQVITRMLNFKNFFITGSNQADQFMNQEQAIKGARNVGSLRLAAVPGSDPLEGIFQKQKSITLTDQEAGNFRMDFIKEAPEADESLASSRRPSQFGMAEQEEDEEDPFSFNE